MELATKVKDEIECLKTLRDELRVKINLGTKDARDLWEDAERKWSDLETKRRELNKVSVEAAREVSVAIGALKNSLRDAYTKIRATL